MYKSIAIICEYVLFPERIGGMDRFFKTYDTALKEKGYQPVWFFKNAEEFNFFKNLNIHSANNSDVEKFFLNYCLTNNAKFDIVITHFLQPVSSFFKDVKKLLNAYIINVDHNPRPLEGFPLKKRIKNKIKGLLYGKYIDKLVGVSAYTKKHILKDFGFYLKGKTSVIYNGIEVNTCKKQIINRQKSPFKFIVVSHLRESKGIQDLLKALYQIDMTNYKNINVDIYGDGPYKNTLLHSVKKYHLESIVHFKGNSPNINELLGNYHYLIQPTYMECFSLSILESLASNVPVITTTVGGNPEIIKNDVNGYIFEPKDINKLTSILKGILDKNLNISKNVSIEIEENYTLDLMVANHLKLVTCT
ncbi:glycosyltransferase family 4 protein [Lutibacter sp.]